MYDQIELYGRVFDRQQAAETAVASLRERVATVQRAGVQGAGGQGTAPRTAAAIFVPVGGGQPYGSGNRSVVDAQMAAAGLTNVFGDIEPGDFEVSLEQVLGRDPDVLIVLTTVDPQAAKDALLALPGVQGLDAVRNDRILVMKYDYTSPPTPLSVDGLEKIVAAFGPRP